jgi:LacI family transcriptional regulator
MQNRTIYDVAAAAGVSIATVSRVLDPDRTGRVSEKARLRVRSAVETLGYRTNHAARSLKTRSSKTVAILAPELGNDFFIALADSMERELSARGYTLLVASSVNSEEEEQKRLSVLAARMVDGIAVIPAGSHGDHLRTMAGAGMPLVLVDRLVNGADIDAVLSDNEAGAFELTRRLLSDGFRRISFVGGDMTISTARERLAGFTRALTEAGLPSDGDVLCPGGMGVDDGYRRMDAILQSPFPPDALVAVNLLVHLGMERRLLEYREHHTTLPVIAAFDETVYTPFLPACRYTAGQNAGAIGKQTALRLLELIERKKRREKPGQYGSEPGTPDAKAGPRIIRLPVTINRH